MWLDDGLTFKGTRLPDNMYNLSSMVDSGWSPFYFVLVGFRYGYADNLPNYTDNSDATSYNYEGCGIDIGWAVDENRQPVSLQFIDFVRVYTGLNQKCPQPEWWGETSTEVQGAEDIHLDESLRLIRSAQAGVIELSADKATALDGVCHDLQGRRVSPASRGVYIRNGRKYFVK